MGVKITWTANTEADMAKYRIYIYTIATGALESPCPEVNHPTAEYTDTDGDETKEYYVTAIDTSDNESLKAGPVRMPIATGICYVYDTLYRPSVDGIAAAENVNVHIDITVPSDFQSRLWSSNSVDVVSDANGNWGVYVPQGSTIQVTCEEFGLKGEDGEKEVPYQASVRFSEI
jgi:hypothetical protein